MWWFRRDGNEKCAGRPGLTRRDLLWGRFWKLVRPGSPSSRLTRYPRDRSDLGEQTTIPAKQSLREIGGIVIEPVSVADEKAPPATPFFPVFRPPGAVEERQFMAGCTRCAECIDACPHDAIRKAPERLGAVAGTPIIEADTSACWMCEGFPCIQACDPGVLQFALPKIMGTAKITEHLCLAHHEQACTVCSERCPVDQAIAVTEGLPTVREEICTGCGACRNVCPAPENAILLMPLLHRPGATQS